MANGDFTGGALLGALIGGAVALGVTLAIIKIASSSSSGSSSSGGSTDTTPPLDPTYSGTSGLGLLHGHKGYTLNRPHAHTRGGLRPTGFPLSG